MPDRDDETPVKPHIAEGYAEIEARVRQRSTRTTELAGVTAMEVALALGVDPHTDPRIEQATLIVRGLIERIIDSGADECPRCRRREEMRKRSEER